MLKRILLFVCGILVFLGSAVVICEAYLGIGVLPPAIEINFTGWEIALAFAILAILGLIAMVLAFTTKKEPSSLLIASEYGEVRVSLQTIDSLVHQGAKKIKGIKELKSRIIVRDGSLYIYVKAVLYGDRNIPELTMQLQQLISEHVYSISGINVDEVKVLVENVATDIKAKVS
ncbi:alkaline shock response membrane anchor protein AmaP [Proteinivorax hydrogeniformans]|uniref:Alkaline shock response membrane anchor protein AmaP n=1 Tax=Proteinivorax hydrogeniformans TaxID=1826727 RepID=A0AAU8HRQ9_9FIRM